MRQVVSVWTSLEFRALGVQLQTGGFGVVGGAKMHEYARFKVVVRPGVQDCSFAWAT